MNDLRFGKIRILAGAQPEFRADGSRATANLCDLLGIQPALGRAFQSEENLPGAPDVAILSHRLWKQRFAGDPAIIGRTIRDQSRSYTVVGVLPPKLMFPIGPMPAWRVVSRRQSNLKCLETVRTARPCNRLLAASVVDSVVPSVGRPNPEGEHRGPTSLTNAED